MAPKNKVTNAETHALQQRIRDLEAQVEALHSQNQRLVEATEHCTDGFALFDADDRFVLCNRSYLDEMDDLADVLKPGVTFEDLIRVRAERNQRNDGIVRDEETIQKRLEQHRNPTGPLERIFDNGQIIRLQEVRIRDGYTLLIRSDVTAERAAESLAERALEESEGRFRALIENANQGIMVVSGYKPVYANQAIAEMYGYDTPDEILGLTSTLVLRATSSPMETPYHQARLQGEDVPLDREILGRRKDGTEFWVGRRSFLIDWEGEKAVCTIRTDITERKLAADELRKIHAELEDKVEARTKELAESDVLFRGALASLQEGFALFDENDNLVIAN